MKLNILKSREAQIGGLILLILILFVWGFNFLKGRNLLTPANYYYCEFEDVGGLMESNFVMVRGYKVGLIEDIKLSENNKSLIVTLVLEDEDLKVPKGSKAVLYNLDMLGTKAVKLELNPNSSYHESGDTIESIIEKGLMSTVKDQFAPLQSKIESVVNHIDSIAASLNNALNETAINDIKEAIANLNAVSTGIKSMVADKNSSLNSSIDNLAEITSSLSDEKHGLKATLKNINSITDSLASSNLKMAINNIDSTVAGLNSVIQKIDSNEGSLGKLVHDKALYDNLTKSTESLNILLEDMQKQPSKYVHLSLIDWGKDVYIDEDGVSKKISDADAFFAIQVKKATNSVTINGDNFADPKIVNELKYKGTYYYTTGKYSDYSQARTSLETLKESYPSAEVISIKENKIIPLQKALK
jgi:phospholipid/cholesterol/gamma-HCH transport system substrate-binding protein